MKRLLYFLIGLGVALGITVSAQVSSPSYFKLIQNKIQPVVQSWGLDFTSSTVTSTRFCLTGDNCITVWPSGGGSSTTTLTNTQIGFGNGDDTITSSPNFTFNSSTNQLSIPNVSSTNITSTRFCFVVGGCITTVPVDTTTTPAGNNTEIQYNNNGVFGGTSGLTWDSISSTLLSTGTIGANNYVGNFMGLGVTNTAFKLWINENTDTTSSPIFSNSSLAITGAQAANPAVSIIGYGEEPEIRLASFNGNPSSRTATVSGDNLGSIGWSGMDTAGVTKTGALIHTLSSATWTTSTMGTNLIFSNSQANFASLVERMRIDASGRVGFSDATPQGFVHMRSTLDPMGLISDTSRYQLVLENPTDSGSIGSGLAFQASATDDNVTGAIIAERTGTNGQGRLNFYTKQSTSSGVAPVLALQLTNAGFVQIPGGLTQTGFGDCDTAASSKVLYDVTTGKFSCGTDQYEPSTKIRTYVRAATSTYTYTVPTNSRYTGFRFWCIGGGGSGGGSGTNNTIGAGGSGAGLIYSGFIPVATVSGGTTIQISVGAGGAAPTAGNNPGNNGTSSTVNISGSLYTCGGGRGGVAANATESKTTGGTTSVAGSLAPDELSFSGGFGQENGNSADEYRGWGGAAGINTVSFTTTTASDGSGQSNFRPNGGFYSMYAGSGGIRPLEGSSNIAGFSPGGVGGGGGSGGQRGTTNQAGGAGANGIIVISEEYE